MKECGRVFTRRMDDLGNINIPREIQEALGLKATELPEFFLSVNQSDKSIRIVPVQIQHVQ